MDDLSGRTICVTGANTGIGRSIATGLAALRADVLVACRSEERARDVIADIAALPGSATFVAIDLADLDSVRAAATAVQAHGPLHVLVNNAGLAGRRGTTAQGFELAFGVNHLGHFLFTTLLLDHLRANAPTRIVNVASDAHLQAKGIDFDAVQAKTRTATGSREYAVSKLANVAFTQALARRLDPAEISAYAVHPGVIASDLWRRIPWPVRPLITRFMKSTEEGAETPLHCATDPGLAGVSGRYYENCTETKPSDHATAELAEALWERSEAWTTTTI